MRRNLQKGNNKALFGIFFIAFSLRIGLALVNRDANDNHIDVINIIADKNTLPEKNDCWSCYQPKLYYVIATGIIKLFHYQVRSNRIICSQILNVAFSILALILIWKFIKRLRLSIKMKYLLFAFFAFNPCLFAINIQVTNDTLAIFSGIGAIYFADGFLKNPAKKKFIGLALFTIAAALTKASGMLLFLIILCSLVLKIFGEAGHKRNRIVLYSLILILSFIIIVPFFGGYYNNYKKFNSLTLSSWNRDPSPLFLQSTPISRPGLTDMFHGWFTFRYFDMIRQPYITNGPDNYPLHRTSLWSQLYGRTMFLHFDQWPESWQTKNRWIINVGRFLIVLGIIPLSLFLMGFIFQIKEFIISLIHDFRKYLRITTNYLHLIAVCAFLVSSIIYSYDYRDFSAMKSIYIFPGLISFVKLTADGIIITKSRVPKTIFIVLFVIILLSIIDITYLLCQQFSYHNLIR